MRVRNAIARILKAEGIDAVFTFPTNPLLEGAAEEGVRIVTARTERHALAMADGYARALNKPAACIVQGGPGAEHAFPGVAQAYLDSTPLLILSGGQGLGRIGLPSEFDAVPSFRAITKWAETIRGKASVVSIMTRAFTKFRMGRPRPILLVTPGDVANEPVDEGSVAYRPVKAARSAADPSDVSNAVRVLLGASNPVLFVGQGVLWSEASDELIAFAERLKIPVITTILGKGAFPEGHPLALGSAGPAVTGQTEHFLKRADVVLAIGAGLTRSLASCEIPAGKTIIQATVDEADINGEHPVDHVLLGDAKLVLAQLLVEATSVLTAGAEVKWQDPEAEIRAVKKAWLDSWMPLLTSNEVPINPYRVIWDLVNTVDRSRTVITHECGMPREQLTPFYETPVPRGYIGWGNSHQLGSSLGLIMGAKLAFPDKIAINVLGDAGFSTCSNDLETGVRERLPVLTVLLNNSTMAHYEQWIPKAIARYKVTDVTGNFNQLSKALGCHAERVECPEDIVPALRRCLESVEAGTSAVLEVITKAERVTSSWGATHLPQQLAAAACAAPSASAVPTH